MSSAFLLHYGASIPASFSDEFDTSANPYVQNGWKGGATHFVDWGDMQTASGHCFGTTFSLAHDDDSLLVRDALSVNHYVRATIYRSSPAYNAGVTHEAQIALRVLGSANSCKLLEFGWEHQSGNFFTARWNGAIDNLTLDAITLTGAGPGRIAQDGDVVEVQLSGTSGQILLNSSQIYTFTTSDYPAHTYAGIMNFARAGATLANYGFHRATVGRL